MGSFVSQVVPTTSSDPSKHVNYTLGMVLGVDDFTQEFAYLSGHDQWIVRDLLGYGTASGLRVSVDGATNNPRVVVGAGVAVSPLGQLIRVKLAQCAYLKDWVAENEQDVKEHLKILSPISPLDGTVPLYVVLCYHECPMDIVPIPGEPCRTEEDSMAPSRLRDDFRLELRFDAPYQIEEVALRDFVKWMHESVEITTAPGQFPNLEDFLQDIRDAVLIPGSPPDAPPASPPDLPPDFMKDLPAIHLRVAPSNACRYLNAAFRLWVTELRPLWRPATLGEKPCCGKKEEKDPADENCVLLARLNVPIIEDKLTGKVLIDGNEHVLIDEEMRPVIAHQRFLQEWLLCGTRAAAGGTVAAAGRFDALGRSSPTPLFSFNLEAIPFGNPGQNFFLLRFKGYNNTIFYAVKGTPIAQGNAGQLHSFDVIPSNDAALQPFAATVPLREGIVVRVRQANNAPAAGFMVEISQF